MGTWGARVLEAKKAPPPEVERRGWSSERVSAVVEPGVEI